MAYLMIVGYLVLIAPIKVGLLVQWEKSRFSITVGLMLWGIRKQFPFLWQRSPEGKISLHAPFPLSFKRRKRRKDLLSLLPRLLYVRKKIRLGIHLRRFQLHALLSLPDAAQTAKMCGLLSAVFALLFPHGHSRFLPSFQGKNRGQGVCIIDFRLGTLLMAILLWKSHELSHNKKEENTWSIPSEN